MWHSRLWGGLHDSSIPHLGMQQAPKTIQCPLQKHKTKTLSPEWNEQFHFLVQEPKTQDLRLQVYDWDGVHFKVCFRLVSNEWYQIFIYFQKDLWERQRAFLQITQEHQDDGILGFRSLCYLFKGPQRPPRGRLKWPSGLLVGFHDAFIAPSWCH